MVLFHDTCPPRGSTSDNASLIPAAAGSKELDVEAMITDIIIEKVLKDPSSPDKGEQTRSQSESPPCSTPAHYFFPSRRHAFDFFHAQTWCRQETVELDGPGHAQGVLWHQDVACEPRSHPRAPQEAAYLRLQAPVHSRSRVEPGKL